MAAKSFKIACVAGKSVKQSRFSVGKIWREVDFTRPLSSWMCPSFGVHPSVLMLVLEIREILRMG